MTKVDMERLERLQARMEEQDLAALVCRLPENVVYLTDYWPHHGFSVAVLTPRARPRLFLPEIEEEYANPEWAQVETFGWGLLKDGDLYQNYRRFLEEVANSLAPIVGKIGVERQLEIVAPSYRMAEPVVPAGPWWALVDEVFSAGRVVDISALIAEVRSRKTDLELELLRRANEIAELGLAVIVEDLAPGMTEAEVGAMVEARIRSAGPGYRGARLVRACAEVGAGPIGSTKGTLLVPSTDRKIETGDIVMIELATVVDGYWSDLTYVRVAGEPNERQRQVHNVVLEAQQAAAQQMRPGASFADPDRAARQVLQAAGLGEYFVHITGHGVGYRYHEFIPFLMPGATGVLEQGMVSSVEPGVYIPDFGGIRIEDNVAVGEQGPIFLSTPRTPWT
jgi:Xaa-Pro dipeptidase